MEIKVGSVFKTKKRSADTGFAFLSEAVLRVTQIKNERVSYDYISPFEPDFNKPIEYFTSNKLSELSPVEKELYDLD